MTLYDIGTVQSNAYLYDCYLFNGTGTKQDQYRKDYLKALVRKLPRLIVVTDQNCFVPDPGFQRLTQWTEFSDLLSRHYQLATVSTSEQTFLLWNRRERRVGFEIYELR
jgi:NAD(P)H-flavin reductase